MSLTPLLEAPGTIPLHAFVAMAAFVLGIVQFQLSLPDAVVVKNVTLALELEALSFALTNR